MIIGYFRPVECDNNKKKSNRAAIEGIPAYTFCKLRGKRVKL